MLEGIGIALQTHRNTVIGAKEILKTAIEQIKANYKGAMLSEKMKEVKEIYNNTVEESRNNNYKSCVEILDDVESQAKKIVESPVSSDFITTFEAIKELKNISKEEIEIIAGVYKNNYISYRMICEFLGGASKGFNYLTIDDIKKDIEYVELHIYQCIKNDSVNEYHYRNWADGELLSLFDKVFRAFTEGKFDDAVNSEYEKNKALIK
ncbi:MAG: hypothetical protein ACI4G1_04950 [Ruminococcus sp.]